jgi:glycosyltransferase involved in cell wall biosynthesis
MKMKLSIITINYNNCVGLQKTIDSVIAQTWRNFEWIIIDGGSTDGSKELISNLNDNPHANICFCCSEPDKGIFNAMNKGIDHAHGEYVNFMNSGDTFYSDDTLEKVFSEERAGDVLYGDWEIVFSDHCLLGHGPEKMELYDLYSGRICHQSIFTRLGLLQRYKFDESFRIAADYLLAQKLFINGASYEHLDVIVSSFDATGVSTVDFTNREQEGNRIIRLLYSDNMLSTFKRLDEYEKNLLIQRVKNLMIKGGISAYLTKLCLRVLGKMFLNNKSL